MESNKKNQICKKHTRNKENQEIKTNQIELLKLSNKQIVYGAY